MPEKLARRLQGRNRLLELLSLFRICLPVLAEDRFDALLRPLAIVLQLLYLSLLERLVELQFGDSGLQGWIFASSSSIFLAFCSS